MLVNSPAGCDGGAGDGGAYALGGEDGYGLGGAEDGYGLGGAAEGPEPGALNIRVNSPAGSFDLGD